MTDIIKAAAQPEGLGILPEQRIGDAHRDRYTAHLADCYARGYLSTDELDRRRAAAEAATTGPQLEVLTADLPPLPAERRVAVAEARSRWRERLGAPGVRIAAHATALAVALMTAIGAPEVVGTQDHWSHSPLLVAVLVAALITGVVAAVADVIWFFIWLLSE